MTRVLAVSIILLTGLVVVLALPEDEAPARRASTVADARCPEAQVPRGRPAERIARITASQARRFESADVLRRFRVAAMFPLGQGVSVHGLRPNRYLRIARRACGEAVARRSWVVVIDMPNAPAATLGQLAMFFARTPDGWTAWQGWLPNYRSEQFFPGD